MSQQKQPSWESLQAPKCSLPQEPQPSPAPSSDPRCAPCAGGCGSGSQSSGTQSPAGARRASRTPRCLRGGTVYHIKEEECWGDQRGEGHSDSCSLPTQVMCTPSSGKLRTFPLFWVRKHLQAPALKKWDLSQAARLILSSPPPQLSNETAASRGALAAVTLEVPAQMCPDLHRRMLPLLLSS